MARRNAIADLLNSPRSPNVGFADFSGGGRLDDRHLAYADAPPQPLLALSEVGPPFPLGRPMAPARPPACGTRS